MFIETLGQGPVSNRMGEMSLGGNSNNCLSWDPGMLRPYKDQHGRRAVILNAGVTPDGTPKKGKFYIEDLQRRGINCPVWVNNATALRREDWIKFDSVAVKAARLRMRAVADLEGAGLTYGGFNGMSATTLEHETVSDVGEAMTDMNALTEGRNFAPKWQLEGVPLAITHADFSIDLRKLTISRNSGQGLDSTLSEMGGRRIGENLERTIIGVDTGLTYGGDNTQQGGYSRTSSIYGYTNFGARLTKVNLYKPTGVGRAGGANGWVPKDTLLDVLAMRDSLYLNKFFGPFMIYHSNDWDQYLDSDYILTGGNVATQTLRDRLRAIEGVQDVRRLDFLAASSTTFASDVAKITTANPWCLIMVQMTSDVVQMVNGLDITTVQWEEKGGMRICFKIMCIKVPRFRADFAGFCGLLHATAASGV